MTTKPFVFENVPEIDDKENYLTDYLEAVLVKDVQKLELLSAIPDRALVTFDNESLDIDVTNKTLQDNPLEDACLQVARAIQQNAVLLDRRQYSHFENYLESNVKDGKQVVQQTFPLPGCELVVVCISSAEALESILGQKEITVQSFFRNFHGCIPLDGHPLSEAVDTAGKRRKPGPPVPPRPKSKDMSAEGDQSGGDFTQTSAVSASEGKGSSKNLVKKLISAFTWPNRGQGKANSEGPVSQPVVPDGKDSPKNEQFVHAESRNEKKEDVEESGRNSDEVQNAGGEDKGEEKTKEGPGENAGEPQRAEANEGEIEDEDKNKKEDEEGEKEDLDTMNKNDERLEWANPLHLMPVSPSSPKLSPSVSPKTELKTPSKKEAPELQSDTLDIDEHIWNLIEGKLDRSEFCSLKYDRRRQILKFRSLNPEACREVVEDLKADIIEGTPLKIPENLRDMFVDLQKKDFFTSCADDYFQRFQVQFFIHNNSIFFFGWDDVYIDKTKAEILHRFMYTDEMENENGMDVDHLRQEKRDLESVYMVNISWTDSQASKILIQGVYDDISLARERLEEVMLSYKNRTDCFEFPQEQSIYIDKHCQHALNLLLRNVKVLFRGLKKGKYVMEYSGRLADINNVSKELEEMKGKIKKENIDISKDLDSEMAELLTKAIIHKHRKSAFSTLQNLFEIETKCCILNDVTQQETHSAQKAEEKRHKKEKQLQPISVQVSPNLKINIKAYGNIIKEKADVLVCPLHESGLLRKLRISKAIMNKDGSLQGKVEELDFSSSQVHSCKMTSEDDGSLKDVIFVLLSPWNENTPGDYLHKLLSETLLKAAQLGAKTLAVPPIGLGVVLKYPPGLIAEQYFSAIKEYKEKAPAKATLNTIDILACDTQLYQTLQAESFKSKSSQSKRRELEETEDEMQEGSSRPQVSIRIIHGGDEESLASLWKERFKSCMVAEDYGLTSAFMPRNLECNIKKKMGKLALVMEKDEADTGELIFKFRGLSEDILTIKAFIAEEVHKDVTRMSHILSEHTPARGTLEFIQYAASINESAPHYWTHQTVQSLGNDSFREVDVDSETAEAIKELFLGTYDSSAAGRGYDAQNIPRQSTIKFVDVKRIENIGKFRQYAQARKRVFEKKVLEEELCQSVSDVSKRGQGCALESYLSEQMKENLCHEVNECYLLHGTKPNIIDTIKRNGCDPNVACDKAMFGKGVYAAECATKCDQYTDDPQNRLPPGATHYAFLLRMLLGDIFVCDDSHVTVQSRDCPKLNRPPCKKCLQDKCVCANTHFYDSVLGEGKWIFREFIVYRDYLCYPEYIISYKRM